MKKLTFAFVFAALAFSAAYIGGTAAGTDMSVLEKATYVYDPQNPAEPDPGVWPKSGMISPSFRADSLAILDPDSVAKLIYFHDASTAFAGAQNNRTASFKVRLKAVSIDNGSPAFNDHVAAGRVILDDGVKRAELQFARKPVTPFERIIKLGGNAAGQPISFNWDNGIFATYEISRALDGKMTVNIVSSDPTIPPASRTYGPNELATTDGAAMFAWGAAELGGGGFGFSEAIGQVNSAETNFASFLVTDLQVRVRAGNGKILAKATFAPVSGQTTDPSTQDVSLTLRRASDSTAFWPTLYANPLSGFVFNGVDTYALSPAEKTRTGLQSFDIKNGAWAFNVVDTRTAPSRLDYGKVFVEFRIGSQVGFQLCNMIENPFGSGNWKLGACQ